MQPSSRSTSIERLALAHNHLGPPYTHCEACRAEKMAAHSAPAATQNVETQGRGDAQVTIKIARYQSIESGTAKAQTE